MSVNAQHYVLHGWSDVNDSAGLIIGRDSSLYFSDWYDTCVVYNSELPYFDYSFHEYGHDLVMPTNAFYPILYKEQYTSQRIKVKGLAAMVVLEQDDGGVTSPVWFRYLQKIPEYLVIGKDRGAGPWPTHIEILDSVRWDDGTPYRLWLPKNRTRDIGYMKCYLYKVMFKEPLYVDSTFYIGGTLNSNVRYEESQGATLFKYFPTFYMGVYSNAWPACCYSRMGAYGERYRGDSSSYSVYAYPHQYGALTDVFGFFFAIVDNHVLEVQSADSTMGQVIGGGLYPDSTYQVIEAVPEFGYLFSHWNDGDTNNQRTVFLDKDTSFVAYFAEDPGVGIQNLIRNDFVSLQVYPNPAKGKVLIETTNADVQRIEIFTTQGVLRKEVLMQCRNEVDIRDLSKGVYIILAHTSHGLVSERLVVE